jgi:hypothetical protein
VVYYSFVTYSLANHYFSVGALHDIDP